ncbi:glycoside hydrolase domain-containing protein [Cohnella abietis]|uniref:Phosphodiester glycosidase domain-containing protein n=1 Tax=Cohnella abietis TaxID=2507935 RepID=A0A3T1D1Y7_9BACL|nr:glycoside hydrolase domain-containing protein [Cohnella abietis]BBI32061.1 hypothetical protein KCTCHS21_14600 [Cohnella abietis]
MIKHNRVRVKNKKLEEGPLQYSGSYEKANGWTDIRVLDIQPAAVIRTELVIAKGKSASAILADLVGKHGGNWVVINASYFNASTGELLGKTIKDGKAIFPDVTGKTEQRPHLFRKAGRFGIGRLNDVVGVDWAVVGVPTLTAGGKAINPLRVEEKTPSDVPGVNPRMIAGIKSDGTLGIIAVDGRGVKDRGLTAEEAGIMAVHLGYLDAINLDGGGSATIATNNRQLLDALEIDKTNKKRNYHVSDIGQNHVQRIIHHVIAVQFDPGILIPKPKTLFGIDCATPLTGTTAKAVAAAGAQFAVRYLVPANYAWKRLVRSEANVIQGAGMMLASVFQKGTDRVTGGKGAGQVDGKEALAEAKLINQPTGSAIFFAVDYDSQPKDYDAIEAYLRAAQAEIPGYHAGVYGHFGVIEEMAKRGACKYFWQTYAWSGGKKSSHIHLYQYKNDTKLGGASVDLNEAYTDSIFWGKDVVPVDKPAESSEVTAIVFGQKIEGAKLIDGVMMLPLRAVGNAIGGKVTWDQQTKTATIE